MNSNLLSIIFCVLVGFVLLAPMVLARRRAPEEQGESPIFESFCSGRSSAFIGANIPIFRLSIYKEFLVICCIKPRVIPFTRLSRVEERKDFLNSGLYLEEIEGASYLLSLGRSAKRAIACIQMQEPNEVARPNR